MKKIKIKRTTKTDFYTIGELSATVGGITILECKTVELPDRDNARKISCIPTGKYIVRKHNSPKFKICLKVFDIDGKSEVGGRSQILLHAANRVNWLSNDKRITELEGCIAPVNYTHETQNGVFGFDSKPEIQKLLNFVDIDDVELEIC